MLSFLYGPTLTSIHTTGKTIALTRQIFVGKVMSLLFNAVQVGHSFSFKEQVSFNFMANNSYLTTSKARGPPTGPGPSSLSYFRSPISPE